MEPKLIENLECRNTIFVRDLEDLKEKYIPRLKIVFYQYIHRQDVFYFIDEDGISCKAFSFRPTRKQRFPFLSNSRRVRLIFNVVSTDGLCDTSFSSSLRLHIFQEELKNIKNTINPGELYVLRKGKYGDLVGDFLDLINFEIRRKFPQRKFSIKSIMTENEHQFSEKNAFSYFYLMNIDKKSVLTVSLLPSKRKQVKQKSNSTIQGTYEEDLYLRLRTCGLFRHCGAILSSKMKIEDFRKGLYHLHTTFFLDRKRFLSLAKPFLLKIERKVLGGNCPEETFVIKKNKSKKKNKKKKKKSGEDELKDKLDTNEIHKQLLKCKTINNSVSKVMKNLKHASSFQIKRNGGLTASLFRTFFEQIIISTILEDDISNFFELSVRGGMGIMCPVLCPRYHSSCKLVEAFNSYQLNSMIELSKKNLVKRLKRESIDDMVKSDLFTPKKITSFPEERKKKKKKKKKKSLSIIHISHNLVPFYFEIAYLYILDGRIEEALRIVTTLIFEASIVTSSSNIQNYRKFLMAPLYSRFQSYHDPFMLDHHERTRVYDNILLDTILSGKRDEFVEYMKKKYIIDDDDDNNQEQQQQRINDFFSAIYRLCWNRGRFDLAFFYIVSAKNLSGGSKSNKNSEVSVIIWKKIEHSLSEMILYFELGQLDKIHNIALWIASLSKKIDNLDNMFKFFDPEKVIQIIMTIEEKEEEEEEEEENFLMMYRIPCFFCSGISVVVGEEEKEKEEEEDIMRELYVAKKCLQYDSKCEKQVESVMLKSYICEEVQPSLFKKNDKKKKKKKKNSYNNNNSSEKILLDFLYLLALTSYMEKKFFQFEKWIVYLSDLEFFKNSYTFSPKYHQLYQVVANLYYFEKKKKKNNNNRSYYNHDPTKKKKKKKKKILLVGDGQVLPFTHQCLSISGRDVKSGGGDGGDQEMTVFSRIQYQIVPIFCDGLRIVHLPGFSSLNDNNNNNNNNNKYRKLMIEKMKKELVCDDDEDEQPIIIFMLGELDIRDRILDSIPDEFDRLSTQFSEDHQIEILAELYIRELENIKKRFNLNRVYIAPIPPFLHPVEEERVFREKQNYGTFNSGCENRVTKFNRLLENMCEMKIKKKKKDFSDNKVKFLSELNRFMMKGVVDSIDLGFGVYLSPTDSFLRSLEMSLENEIFD